MKTPKTVKGGTGPQRYYLVFFTEDRNLCSDILTTNQIRDLRKKRNCKILWVGELISASRKVISSEGALFLYSLLRHEESLSQAGTVLPLVQGALELAFSAGRDYERRRRILKNNTKK
jgi:hypothetical protein